jgi:hypothetical protein
MHLLNGPVPSRKSLGHHRCIHAAELAAPLVERRQLMLLIAAATPVCRLGLIEYDQDLAIGESGFFAKPPRKDYEKISDAKRVGLPICAI